TPPSPTRPVRRTANSRSSLPVLLQARLLQERHREDVFFLARDFLQPCLGVLAQFILKRVSVGFGDHHVVAGLEHFAADKLLAVDLGAVLAAEVPHEPEAVLTDELT